MIIPQMPEQGDTLEIDYFYFICASCRTCTEPVHSDWIAAGNAQQEGWRKVDGEIYCKDCTPLAVQREEERQDEE